MVRVLMLTYISQIFVNNYLNHISKVVQFLQLAFQQTIYFKVKTNVTLKHLILNQCQFLQISRCILINLSTYFRSMIESERPMGSVPDHQYDYQNNTQIQESPSFFNKFFFFNRIFMVYTYITNLKKQTLFRYNDNFKPVLTSTRILESYFKRKQQNQAFNVTGELFRLEKRTLVTLIILSIVAGGCSLVPIYFQSVLVKAVIGNISDYGSLYAIIGAMIGRFLLLNYLLNLSSNIAINVKLQLQNTFMRAIFYLEQSKYDLLKNRIKYLDVDLVGEAIYYIPYIITSIILVLGAVGLTFIYVSPYAVIVVGIYLFLISMIILIGRFSLHNMKLSRRRVAERQRFSRRSINNLLNAAFQRMSDYVYQFLVIQKTLETKLNIKINLQYIFAQTLGECCIVASVITLFALAHNDAITYSNAYYAVLFLTTTFYPMRYSVYGYFTALKAYQAYRQIRLQLSNVSKEKIREMRFSSNPHLGHVFAQNIGGCFQYTYNPQPEDPIEPKQGLEIQIKGEQIEQVDQPEPQLRHTISETSLSNETAGIKMKTLQQPNMPTFRELAFEGGAIIMMLTKVDSLQPEGFYKRLLRKNHPSMSATKITARQFMLPDTLKQNICFYSPFDEEKYNKVLEITQLEKIVKELSGGPNKQHGGGGGEQYIKFCEWHSTRIQIARALYNNVEFLLIDKPIFLQDEDLVKNVIAYRRESKKITLIANNIYWHYYKLADKILIFDKNTYQFGDYGTLQKNHKSLLNTLFLRHRQAYSHIEKVPELPFKDFLPGIVTAPRVQENTIEHLEKGTFFQLFGLVHKKSQFIVIAALFAAPCFKYYLQYLIGTSTTQRMFWSYFGFGLGYLALIFIRGLTLSLYTNYGSLSLYQKICRKNRRLNAHQIMELSQKPVFDFDYHQRIIDRNLVMDFQYGQSILIEIMINFIVLCTGNPLYIAVAIPIILGIVFVNSFFARNARKIYLLKLKETKGVHKIVSTVVEKALRIARYQKADDFNKLFQQQNKIQTIYDLNIQWLQTGIRTSAQIIVFICFIVFLIIMIKTVQNLSNYTSLVSLGCAMFINLLYLNTFYLKAFRQMEISLYSLTLCFDKLRSSPLPTPRQVGRDQHFYLIKRIMQVQSIRYKDVSLAYFKNVCDKINLTINEGDRLVLSGNSNSFKEMVFYMLKNKIFDRDEVRGDIIINGKSEEEFIIDGLFYLHSDPVLPFFGTVYQALKLSDTSLNQSHLQTMLIAFFNVVGTDPLFDSNTQIDHLTLAQKQLFELFRVLKIQKCKVLVIVNGLDHIDIITRRRLTKYLMRNTDINILIETTNISEIVHMYPRRFIFKNLKIHELDIKLEEAHSLKRVLESKQSVELLIERPQYDRLDQTNTKFDSIHPFNPFQ